MNRHGSPSGGGIHEQTWITPSGGGIHGQTWITPVVVVFMNRHGLTLVVVVFMDRHGSPQWWWHSWTDMALTPVVVVFMDRHGSHPSGDGIHGQTWLSPQWTQGSCRDPPPPQAG